MDEKHLIATLAGAYAYYEKDLSKVAIAVWKADLAGYEKEAIDAAFIRHRRDPERGQWLPKIADILRHLRESDHEKRQIAWAHVLEEVRRVGAYGDPNLTEEQRSAMHACGGWRAICHCDQKDLSFMQRRFMEAFDAFESRSQRTIALAAPKVMNLVAGIMK
jgi:hypothetical protein